MTSRYLGSSGRDDVLSRRARRIPVGTPAGEYNVRVKRVGNIQDLRRLLVMLLHGGPGATDEYRSLSHSQRNQSSAYTFCPVQSAGACAAAWLATCWPTALSSWATVGLAALASSTVMQPGEMTKAPVDVAVLDRRPPQRHADIPPGSGTVGSGDAAHDLRGRCPVGQ